MAAKKSLKRFDAARDTAKTVVVSTLVAKITHSLMDRYDLFKENRQYSITASSKELGSSFFVHVCTDLANRALNKEFKSLAAVWHDGGSIIPDSQRPYSVCLNGVMAQVTVKSPNKIIEDAIDQGDWSSLNNGHISSLLTITSKNCRLPGVFNDFLTDSHEAMERKQRRVKVHLPSSWGGWEDQFKAPTRKISSVFLQDNLAQDILNDLKKFLTSEDTYTNLGMPYHRAYCFYGPPGTGKSSFLAALCHEIKYNLCYLSIHDMQKDSSLMKLVSSIPEFSVLIIEDIDTMNVNREDDKEKISLASLLNALDGIVTPPGLITFITTNNLDALDPALLRKGRIDKLIEVGYTKPCQVNQIFKSLYDIDVKCSGVPADTPMSDVTELFKIHDTSSAIIEDLQKAGFTFSKRR